MNVVYELDRQLRALALTPLTCSSLGALGALAERADVVIVCYDGVDSELMTRLLDALERWQSGPALLVVGDGPLAWRPSIVRDLPAIKAPSSFFEWWCDRSDPELPFTD
jgi:hypothetical protein